MTYDSLFSVTEFSAGARPTQGKPKGLKTLTNLENNIDFFDFFLMHFNATKNASIYNAKYKKKESKSKQW